MNTKRNDIIMQGNAFMWVALGMVIILMVPFIAMQIGDEVRWDRTDFIIMGALLFSMGSLFVTLARMFRQTRERMAIGIGVALVTLYIWAELAVGIFTTWGS